MRVKKFKFFREHFETEATGAYQCKNVLCDYKGDRTTKAGNCPGCGKPLQKSVSEDAPANAAGLGGVAGIGIGPKGEPGVDLRKRKKDIAQMVHDAHLDEGATKRCGFDQHSWVVDTPKSDTPKTLMRCDNCDIKMTIARIEQQNKMMRMKRVVDLIRNNPDSPDNLNEGYLVNWEGTAKELREKGWKVQWSQRPPVDSTRVRIVTRDDGDDDEDREPGEVETAEDNPRRLGRMLESRQLNEMAPADTFGGVPVFEVDMDRIMKARFGKHPRHRYSRYVGDDEVGESIRQHGRTEGGDIILKDSATSVMTFLKRKSVK